MFHVNTETGEAGKCSSKKGKCPFGSPGEHFTSIESARANYESSQTGTYTDLKDELIAWRKFVRLDKSSNRDPQLPQLYPRMEVDQKHLDAAKKMFEGEKILEGRTQEYQDSLINWKAYEIAGIETNRKWSDDLREKAKNKEWVSSLNDFSLDTLRGMLSKTRGPEPELMDRKNITEGAIVYREVIRRVIKARFEGYSKKESDE